jgi:hypothetical protein
VSNFLLLAVSDSLDTSVENCNPNESEEVRKDNLDAAKKQQLSKKKKSK